MLDELQAGTDNGRSMGLALSGGGFRAMLFHVGAVWRLNELGLLRSMSHISSVSGGSLFNGRLAARWHALEFKDGVATNYVKEVAEPVIRFATWHVDVPAIIMGMLPIANAARIAALCYRFGLVGKMGLHDLPDSPRFVFNATHLPSGTSWRFSKPYMACYRVGMVKQPRVSLAMALAASAAFPPVLSPLVLKTDPDTYERVEGADLFDRRELRESVPLSDGGVYDNLALQTLESSDEVLVSDGGGGLTVKTGPFWLWPVQMSTVLDTAIEQSRALRRTQLVRDFQSKRKRGALWRTKTDVTNPRDCPVPPAFAVQPGWPNYMFTIRTRLNPFTDYERYHLVNWGYLVTDTVIRNWYLPTAAPATRLPYPNYDFAAPPPTKTAAGGA